MDKVGKGKEGALVFDTFFLKNQFYLGLKKIFIKSRITAQPDS